MKKVLLVLLVAFLILAVGLACYAWARTDQTRNSIKLLEYVRVLERHHEESERYPSTVSGYDYYGFPLIYLSDGDSYILVGVGKDGKADQEYHIGSSLQKKDENCLSPSKDTIVVSGRVVVGCLK